MAASLAYVVPGWEGMRPWNRGEPLPLLRSLLPRAEARVVEDEKGELLAAPVEIEAPAAVPSPVAPAVASAAPESAPPP
ncbi:MAG: hypothetical protein FJ090_16600, partial [Deltaproteobacteria bacterium]|nr:hypothetical protein [Deltaproteobacteria bacterium]